MSAQDILKKLPSGGFFKVSAERTSPLAKDKRAALIRKGNELYNKGELALAQRIFVTTSYSDGLIRMGDRYLKGGKPLEALRMYLLAPAPDKSEAVIGQIAQVMHHWLAEGKTDVHEQ